MADCRQPPAALDNLVAELTAEPQPLRRRQILLAARDCWSPETVTRLYDETIRLVRIDLGQADRLARAAAWMGEQLNDDYSRATGSRALGHIAQLRRKYEPAREYYKAALGIYERLGKELEIGRTLNGSLQTLVYLGRWEEAFTCASRAERIFTKLGERRHLARLDIAMGNVLHRLDRFDEALERYRRALGVCEELRDFQYVAIALRNMATCQIQTCDFREALETYNRARVYCAEHDMPLLVAEADYNIAYLYYLRGEYTRAIEMYRAARERCIALGDRFHQALCDLDQSEMYLELNLSEEGAHLARRALNMFRQLGMGYESAKALTNIAIASSHHGDTQFALELFGKARELFRFEHNDAWVATIDLYQALVFYHQRSLQQARTLCESAFEFFSKSPLVGRAVLSQLILSRIHLDSGRPEVARAICIAALQSLDQTESPALSYQAFFVLGLIEEALGWPEHANEAYLKAHGHLENLRSHLRTDEVRIAFLMDKQEVYESLVRMSLDRRTSGASLELAFQYIEQAKSRSLADLIAFRAHSLPAPTATHRLLVEQVRDLRERLNWYTRALQLQEGRTDNLHDPQMEKLHRAARDCEQKLIAGMTTLRVEDQEFASLQSAASIDLEAIRSALADDAMLVQYYRVGETFQVCLLSRRLLKIVPLGWVPNLRRAMQLLRFQLSKFRLHPDYVATFRDRLREATDAHLQDFYRQLIAPIEKDLKAAHLVIAPHDFLHYLPFHALLDGAQYLHSRYSISYTPSASVYYLCCTKQANTANRSLVLGVPDPAAPQILNEVRAVASVLPNADVYVGLEATHQVLQEKGSQSRFVHIATHGWFRQDNPMFSSIKLGTSELSLFDLYQLNLPAELVTLSGCGTGLNVVLGGDELMGLKRGLLYAGAQGVLLTLWDVNDRSTADFMQLFYRRLMINPNKAQALQYAMEEIRKAYAHPFYWAPFVLVGKYL
ncbi:MAG: CHAT domain-containing protein [Bryobacteraceae bacterium]